MLIICIGDGSEQASYSAQNIAHSQNLEYRGVLDAHTQIQTGVYHTSHYDITSQELLDIAGNAQLIELDSADPAFLSSIGQHPVMQYLTENKSFCGAAFGALVQNHDGEGYRFCCYQNKLLTTKSFDYSNDIMNGVRQDMIAGNPIAQCEICTTRENNNLPSPRQLRTKQMVELSSFRSVKEFVDNNTVFDYDIRTGNRCNAQCRMCCVDDSHLLDKEFYKLGITDKLAGLSPPTNFAIVDIPNVKRLYVAGGEPTISREFIDFLKECVEQNRTDFLLQINTNAFVLSKKFLDIIKHFSNVEFIVSVDGFEDALYYIRYPITWDKLAKNICTLDGCGRVCFNISVSIYNAARLYPLVNYLNTQYTNSTVLINWVDEPSYMWFGNHPNKTAVTLDCQKLMSTTSYRTDHNFNTCVNHIIKTIKNNDIDHETLKTFFEFNNKLDVNRNIRLQDYLPEIIGPIV